VGLVLGGGGAKGLAHIGVLRALADAGIPVDMIGGSSMGAIVAGLRAVGWDTPRMIEQSREIFLKQNPFHELTLPLVSLVRSRGVDRILKAVFGDRRIEDLPMRFFCTSSNLNSCALSVHRTGHLWKAIRMSCSLPVIMAPVPFQGEVHLDGGVLNNLPCDVMRAEAGCVIAVDVDTQGGMVVDFEEFPSAGRVIWNRIRRKGKRHATPNIVDITLATFRASNRMQVDKVKSCADLCIEPPVAGIGMLAFSLLDDAVRIGYDCTKKTLESLPADSPLRAFQAGACRDDTT
jgi:predicted acylesterase/phospholipase RssA